MKDLKKKNDDYQYTMSVLVVPIWGFGNLN